MTHLRGCARKAPWQQLPQSKNVDDSGSRNDGETGLQNIEDVLNAMGVIEQQQCASDVIFAALLLPRPRGHVHQPTGERPPNPVPFGA
jgi:hypothetical protein